MAENTSTELKDAKNQKLIEEALKSKLITHDCIKNHKQVCKSID